MMKKFKVDVIIPTYKPNKQFCYLLNQLEKQDWPIEKIRIINTEEQYFLSKDVSNDPKVEVMHISKEEFDHGGTRDLAVRLSQADIVLFLTQDAMPQNEHLVRNLVSYFDDEAVGAAYARQLPVKDCNEIERFTRNFNYPEQTRIKSIQDLDELGIKTFFCSNVCAAYRKKTYMKLGGFVKRTIFNEDMIFAGKLIQSGMKIAYAADALVVHSHNYTNMQQFHRNFDIAVSQVTHPEIFGGIASEGEGIRLVLKTIKHCFYIKKPWLACDVILKSAFKFIGYKMGQRFEKLPQWMILRCTMNPEYWKNNSD